MDRGKFIKEYEDKMEKNIKRSDSWIRSTIEKCQKWREEQEYKSDEMHGRRGIIMLFEEMAELQKELTKFLRDKGDRYNILQELGDVYICLTFVKNAFNITDDELSASIDTKLENFINKVELNPEEAK